jgi:hypothetical protein
MAIVYVSYSEKSNGGEKINPSERWSDREDTITEFEVTGISLNKPSDYFQALEANIPEDAKEAYVVHVRYSTGDTFGRETGRGKITNVCLTQEEAEAILGSIENNSHPDSYIWSGYFERLESSHANKFPLANGTKSLHRTYR